MECLITMARAAAEDWLAYTPGADRLPEEDLALLDGRRPTYG